MRTTTAGEDAVLQATTRRVDAKARVKNADGTWIELTNLSSINWLDQVEWGETVDQPAADAVVRLHKYASDGDNLAPLDETSPLNVDDLAAYAALLDAGREVDIQAATVAIDASPSGGDFKTLFHGEIDRVDWGDEQVVVYARDYLVGHLLDRWIEEPTVYGTEAGRAMEDVLQDMLDDWSDGRVTLWVPVSPGALVKTYEQPQMPVYEAMIQRAQQIGWDLRSRWNESSGEYQLQLFEPDRSPSSTDWDFQTSDIFAIRRLAIDRDPIRNFVSVRYSDDDGVRRSIKSEAAASIDRFGRRWMRVEEPTGSGINTATEASNLSDAILSDLKDPQADQETEQDFFWPVELQDYCGFEADERWYSTDQDLGVYGIRHRLSMSEQVTLLQVRGKPAGQYLRWRNWAADPTNPDADANRILDLREVARTTTTVTYAWSLGPEVANVWILRNDATQPVSADPWPTGESEILDVLGRDTTEYTFDLPPAGTASYVHLEPTDGSVQAGPIRRLIILPLSDDPDRIVAFAVRVDESDGSVEVRVAAPETCQSYRYAYSVGPSPSFPSDAAVEAGTVRTISGVDGFTLGAGTVGGKEWIVIRACGYVNNDGTGPDGTAADHGPIVDARDKRVTPISTSDIQDAAVTVDKVTRQAQRFFTDIDFSADDGNTVSWTSGSVEFADGQSYSVASGDTGDMPASTTHWIYFDPDVSTTVLQVTTDRADIVGENRILMCTAWPSVVADAGFAPAVGVLGLNDVNIAANSITANKIRANAVTATKINVVSLSAIAADLGTVTAGTVGAAVVVASTSFTAASAVFDGSVAIQGGGGLNVSQDVDCDTLFCVAVDASGGINCFSLQATGGVQAGGDMQADNFNKSSRPSITGSRGGNAALASLLTAFDGELWNDNSSA